MGTFPKFVESLANLGGLSLDEAERVARLYLSPEMKIAKIDGVSGALLISHGAFMDRDVIRRALASLSR